MPRGVRRRAAPSAPDVTAMEQELEQLKERQAELRRELRERKKGSARSAHWKRSWTNSLHPPSGSSGRSEN
jgi:hypothetical protein